MKAFTVRRINDSDLDDFIRIRLEALRLYPAAFGASYEDWKQKSAEFFAEKLRVERVFGGFDLQNTLQGMIGVSSNTAPKLRHVATIWGMYVRAEMRGTGLSKSLMAAAIKAASGAKTIKLSVMTTNRATQILYRSFGFREWATDTAALCVDGVFYDELLMRLDAESSS